MRARPREQLLPATKRMRAWVRMAKCPSMKGAKARWSSSGSASSMRWTYSMASAARPSIIAA